MLGWVDGDELGVKDGARLGFVDGDLVGTKEGNDEGSLDGALLGWADGDEVGAKDGTWLGFVDGDLVGIPVGSATGLPFFDFFGDFCDFSFGIFFCTLEVAFGCTFVDFTFGSLAFKPRL